MNVIYIEGDAYLLSEIVAIGADKKNNRLMVQFRSGSHWHYACKSADALIKKQRKYVVYWIKCLKCANCAKAVEGHGAKAWKALQGAAS